MEKTQSKPDYKDKFVAYIDILGWKNLVEASERGTGMPLARLLRELEKFGGDREAALNGPRSSVYADRALDFQVTQVSDCAVISSAASPKGLGAIIFHCYITALNFLASGIMCRGYITMGSVFHERGQPIGTAYQEACGREKGVEIFKFDADDRGTPFIEIDAKVCN